MRINKFIAQATGLSRRAADAAIEAGRVQVNGDTAKTGQLVEPTDIVSLDEQEVILEHSLQTIMLNKPVGYVCSRDGQGSKTVYDLLPKELHLLKPVGRLDKDSSGLLLLTNDGKLANDLTHPRYQKTKIYEVILHKPLTPSDKSVAQKGVVLNDGVSRLKLSGRGVNWIVAIQEGRNRQIRRTFAALRYKVVKLHRTQFGPYALNSLESGKYNLLPLGK